MLQFSGRTAPVRSIDDVRLPRTVGRQRERWRQEPAAGRTCERLITLSTSTSRSGTRATLAASPVRACTSSNSRVFSIAITAWSAKVLRSSICRSVNGRTSVRRTRGLLRSPRWRGPEGPPIWCGGRGGGQSRSPRDTGRRSACVVSDLRCSVEDGASHNGPTRYGHCGTQWAQQCNRPVVGDEAKHVALDPTDPRVMRHRRGGPRSTPSRQKCGSRSVDQVEIARKMSAVAACCSRASASSRLSSSHWRIDRRQVDACGGHVGALNLWIIGKIDRRCTDDVLPAWT